MLVHRVRYTALGIVVLVILSRLGADKARALSGPNTTPYPAVCLAVLAGAQDAHSYQGSFVPRVRVFS